MSGEQSYGATYCTEVTEDFGKITAIFEVAADWDGYRFHGYCVPTAKEIFDYQRQEKTTAATDVVSVGFAPNGQEMFSWSEGEIQYVEYWMTVPGGGLVQHRSV